MNVLQGVTLTDLKEAQKTYSSSPQDRQTEEGGTQGDRKDLTDDRRVKISLTESTETTETRPKWSKMDEVREIHEEMVYLKLLEDVCDLSVSSEFFLYSRGTLNPG